MCDISSKLVNLLRQLSPHSLMLTGGRSATKVYKSWASMPDLMNTFLGVDFYFGDERCVPPNHQDSNYNLTTSLLFPMGVPKNISMHRMEADHIDSEFAAGLYEKLLPKSIDLILLSVGDDGHIASLFPNSSALHEDRRLVMPVLAPYPPYKRFTITPKVIKGARNIVVIAEGVAKKKIYEKALQEPDDIDSIPARLVLNRTWIFD